MTEKKPPRLLAYTDVRREDIDSWCATLYEVMESEVNVSSFSPAQRERFENGLCLSLEDVLDEFFGFTNYRNHN